MQQGRVTLEADVNESETIAQEELREETLDIVGPVGTPDDGFAITAASGPFDFHVSPGTLYVGGLRVVEATGFDYGTQPDWLDRDGDPLWIDPLKLGQKQTSEHVVLLLREQEVGAVEDRPLRDVALGGPDSAQRTRLIRRVLRLPTGAEDCEKAGEALAKDITALGVTWDPETLRLLSPARLQVQFVEVPEPEDPCDPAVDGGYLGADNQLIRVQITHLAESRGAGRFVWGYNNASFFYRVKAVDAQTLELESLPIDGYHTPRPNKAVEVLRSAVDLGHDDYISAHSGFVSTPTAAFVPETKRLALPSPLPSEYVDPEHTTPLFLRLWEQELDFTSGTPVELPGTGLEVVIDLGGAAGLFTVGQFWNFAVRPRTPVNVYPQRYLDAPQPPEGPRLWLASLAVIGWKERTFTLIEDCRPPFDNLVELTKRKSGCCSVVVEGSKTPPGALQRLLDEAAKAHHAVSLRPGVYELAEPLRLGPEHSGLVFEGCQDEAVIRARAGAEAAFPDGLIIMERSNEVTFRRLRFRLPVVPRKEALHSIGLRPVHCANLVVEDCLFRFAVDPRRPTTSIAIYGGSELWNLRLTRNRFLHEGDGDELDTLRHTMVGLGVLPQAARKADGTLAGAERSIPLLDNAEIEHNEFAGLSFPIYVRAVLGRVRCHDNFVRISANGFLFLDADVTKMGELVRQSFRTQFRNRAEQDLHRTLFFAAQPEAVKRMDDVARALPLPAGFEPREAFAAVPLDGVRTKVVRADAKAALAELLAGVRGAGAAEGPAAEEEEEDEAGDRRELAKVLDAYRWAALSPDRAATVRLAPALHFANNDVTVLPFTQRAKRSGSGLMVVVGDEGATVMLLGNRFRGRTLDGVASVAHPSYAVVSGNLFVNDMNDERARSLVLHAPLEPAPLVSVTGNGFRGRPSSPTASPAGRRLRGSS
jgi:hypothetical protein